MANDLLRSDSMNADAMYVRGLCLYYEDFVDKVPFIFYVSTCRGEMGSEDIIVAYFL